MVLSPGRNNRYGCQLSVENNNTWFYKIKISGFWCNPQYKIVIHTLLSYLLSGFGLEDWSDLDLEMIHRASIPQIWNGYQLEVPFPSAPSPSPHFSSLSFIPFSFTISSLSFPFLVCVSLFYCPSRSILSSLYPSPLPFPGAPHGHTLGLSAIRIDLWERSELHTSVPF